MATTNWSPETIAKRRTKYIRRLQMLFDTLSSIEVDEYFKHIKPLVGREITPEVLTHVVIGVANYGRRQQWDADRCFRNCISSPRLRKDEEVQQVYRDVASSLAIRDELFEDRCP